MLKLKLIVYIFTELKRRRLTIKIRKKKLKMIICRITLLKHKMLLLCATNISNKLHTHTPIYVYMYI